MNKLSFFLFLFFSTGALAQKNIIVLDKVSHKPIENVNVFSLKTQEGSYTNADGKVRMPVTDAAIKLSHLSYRDTTVSLNASADLDSVFLSPRAIELKQVRISSFNVRKELNYILDHYDDLYVNVPTAKECTFKEAFLVDKQYKRLILSQIEWWSKSSAHSLNGNYSKFVKLRLGNIDFNRNDPMGIFKSTQQKDTSSRSSFLDPKSLINNIYFNYVVRILLSYPENISSTVEDSPDDQLIVSFESEPKQVKDFSSVATGRIVFDKATKAVIQYSCSIEFKGNIDNRKAGSTAYTYEQKKSIANYTFSKQINNQWSLKHCELHADGVLDYQDKKHDFTFENSLYVLKETEAKKIEDKGTIDLDKSIYQNFPSQVIVNSNPILLSKTEQEFISKK